MQLEVKAHGESDIGRKRRQNEDSFIVAPELGLYAVADGMGGHSAGEVASKRAIEVVHAIIGERLDVLRRLAEDPSVDNATAAQRLVAHAIQAACAEIHRAAEANPKLRGMGTTFVCFVIAGDRGIIGHVGDSRLYICRRGQAQSLTEDHSLLEAQIRSGEITREDAAKSSFKGVLTRALGAHESVQVDTFVVELMPGDRFLLCSDGLHGYLTDEDLARRFAEGTVGALPDELIAFANSRGGKDNITAIVISVEARGAAEAPALTRTDALRAIPLFSHLTYRELSDVLARATTRAYPPSATIVTEGEPGGDLFVILDGRVSVERGGVQIATLAQGGHFGEIGLIEAGPRSATIRAIDEIRAMVIRRDDLMGVMQRDPALAMKLLWVFVQVLSQRLRATNSELEEALMSSGPETVPFLRR